MMIWVRTTMIVPVDDDKVIIYSVGFPEGPNGFWVWPRAEDQWPYVSLYHWWEHEHWPGR